MENTSTTGGGQNRLGIKPKTEPGGSELDPMQQSIQAKKNSSEPLLNRNLNCC